MTKYEVNALICGYGIFENGEFKLVVNSKANALLIKYVLEQDIKHKVVIKDLLKSKDKPKHKFRAMTNEEFCRKWEAKHNGRCFGKYEPFASIILVMLVYSLNSVLIADRI